MTDFKISETEIEALYQKTRSFCGQLNGSIRNCTESMMQIMEHAGLTGQFADAFKSYLQNPHLVILGKMAAFAQELCDYMKEYRNAFFMLEQGEGFALDQGAMQRFSEELQKQKRSLEDNFIAAEKILQNISDVCPLSLSAPTVFAEETEKNLREVKHLEEDVNRKEQIFLLRLPGLESKADAIGKAVQAIGIRKRITGQANGISLLPAGFTREMMKAAESLGYGAEDLANLGKACGSEEEKRMLDCLFRKEYESAFSAHPGALSDTMNLVLADYAFRLFHGKDYRQLQNFMNAALSQTEGYGLAESVRAGAEKNRDAYLSRLYQGTMLLLQMNSYEILQGNTGEQTKSRNFELLELANLWNAQIRLSDDLRYLSDPEMPYQICFEEENQVLHTAHFRFLYTRINHNPFSNEKRAGMVDVRTDLLETSDDLVTGIYLSERGKKSAEEEDLIRKVLGETALETAFAIVSVVKPELGTAMNMMKTFVTDNMDSADNKVMHMAGNTMDSSERTGSAVMEKMIDGVQSYIRQNHALSEQIGQLDHSYEGALWGSGALTEYQIPDTVQSGFRSYVISGVYNPDYLEKIGNWNREGLKALAPDIDLLQIENVLAEPYYADCGKDSLVYKMIFGFNGESILDYPISETAQAKTTVENIVREAYGTAGRWNLENAF